MKTYSIFGAGAAGLYTAWRLLGGGNAEGDKDNPKALNSGDTLELYDWGRYAFNKENPGTRAAGRVFVPGITRTMRMPPIWKWAACGTPHGTVRRTAAAIACNHGHREVGP